MPVGTDPPDPQLTSTVFNALAAMNYDSGAMAFKNAAGEFIYMFLERGTTLDNTKWLYGTDTEGAENPRGQIPQLTYDVVHGGTLNVQTQNVSYAGKYYRIRIYRASTKQYAQAIEVP